MKFYKQHYARLRYRLRVLVRDDAAAEDLLADTMTLMWSRWRELAGPSDEADGFPRMRAYAYRTAYLKLVRYRQRVNYDSSLTCFEAESEIFASYNDASVGVELAETVREIARLPEQQRQTLVLKLLGYEDEEVAEKLGVKQATVRSNLTHARRKIVDYLARHAALAH
ncbi:sigma-70 family RNA polymerase sigma factor [Actinosynnema sp. NPDC051121]